MEQGLNSRQRNVIVYDINGKIQNEAQVLLVKKELSQKKQNTKNGSNGTTKTNSYKGMREAPQH